MINSFILADVAPDAGYTRNFEYCVKVTNLKEYPDRLFFVRLESPTNAISPPYQLLESDRCISISGYRTTATIAAIKRSELSDLAIQNINSTKSLNNDRIQKFLIKGTPTISAPHSVPILNEGKQVVANIQIQSIDDNSLKLKSSDEFSATLNVFLFPAIGMAILGWLVWRRDRQPVN